MGAEGMIDFDSTPVLIRGGLSRRSLFQIGAPLIGLGLADFLRMDAGAAEAESTRPTSRKSIQ